MPLSRDEAVAQVRRMIQWRNGEAGRLYRIREYLRSEQQFTWLPSTVPAEIRRLAEMSRVNVLQFVVNAGTQSLYVDGYRAQGEADEPAWDLWQANRMTKRQIGIHRSAISYGTSYSTVMPGDPVPVIRGVSARNMTAVYGEDPDWPLWALEQCETEADGKLWKLYDEYSIYYVSESKSEGTFSDAPTFDFVEQRDHMLGVVPVVRYQYTDDLDGDVRGVVEPLFHLQDQVNLTTFNLLVAQHYGAHRQRYVIGWEPESDTEGKKATASAVWTFGDDPDMVKVGEFEQTELGGYVESREASLRHIATISQTPVHELLGSIANLSAEALVAARDSHNRAMEELRTVFGESHEQTLDLAGQISGEPVADPGAWVRWRDMESRALGMVADALGKLVTQLGIPAEAMWERVADTLGVAQDEVEEWKRLRDEGDPIAQMNALLESQGA